jgi:catechol 2,3-dioxygenase-like lactoylglutathione lyase family enzyme
MRQNLVMIARLFDHLDLRVRDLAEADAFYGVILPALGFPVRGVTSHCIYFEAVRDQPKPEFVALIEDRAHQPAGTRIAFWCATKAAVDAFAQVLAGCAAGNVEGPMFCPEYSPTYYALFFDDPCGNRLEVCCRTARATREIVS